MINDKTIEKIKFLYSQDDVGCTMRWVGECSMQYPHLLLEPYFTELIPSVSEFKSFTLNFLDLEYMNSSTVQPILHLIKGLNTLNIPINIHYSKDKKWQVLSFQTFKAITKILTNVSVNAK